MNEILKYPYPYLSNKNDQFSLIISVFTQLDILIISKRELISISHQEAMFAPELIHKRVNLTEITEAIVYDVLREGKQCWACNWQYLFAF